mmetsp:Transcript_13317/g.15265  ORF Transcript_13317/g.15265 Transcript_13317/m.15265 type:complete len:350 (+) Transcript_13317:72-1121(+)
MKFLLGFLLAFISSAVSEDIPELVAADAHLSSFATALNRAGIVNKLSNPLGLFTVFAPTDEAFANMLPTGVFSCLLLPDFKVNLIDIMKYHVVKGKIMSSDLNDGMNVTTMNGDVSTIDLSNINSFDIKATNGVIHTTASVLIPIDVNLDELFNTCRNSLDISQMITLDTHFTTLPAALDASSLLDSLSDPAGPFTMFAPPDDAFKSLPDGLITCLLKPENKETLAHILKHHIIEGKVMTSDMIDDPTFTTLNGDNVIVDATSGIKINNSRIIFPDVITTNGVIHAIDSVLIPADMDINGFLKSCDSTTILGPITVIARAEAQASSSVPIYWNICSLFLSIGLIFTHLG